MSARSYLVTPYVTVRGSSNITSVTQDADDWIELPNVADATFFIEVAEVSNPGSGQVLLYLETAPTRDESLFLAQPVAGPIMCVASPTPLVAKTCSAIVPLSRYLRWRIVSTNASAFDVTFRIRMMVNRSPYFAPTQLGGCICWLRSDLGITLNATATTVAQWNDQSGLYDSNRNVSQSNATIQPNYTLVDPNYGNHPSINSGTSGGARYLVSQIWNTSYAQPTSIYFCGLLASGTQGRLFDGQVSSGVRQGVTENVGPYAMFGGSTTVNTTQTSGTRGVGCAIFNAASSQFFFQSSQTNKLTAANPGPSNINCLGIFATQDALGAQINCELVELAVFTGAHTAAQRYRMFRYLGTRYAQSFS